MPNDLWPENETAWEVFCDCAQGIVSPLGSVDLAGVRAALIAYGVDKTMMELEFRKLMLLSGLLIERMRHE